MRGRSLHLTDKKEKWFETFARVGIISKGVVYCLIAILTVMAALGLSSDKANKADALKVIYQQPLGKIILALVAFGLLGYVTWRFLQAVYDIDHKGKETKGTLSRIGYGFSALVYLSLCLYAVKLLLNGSSGSDGGSQKFIISKVLTYPMGEWLVAIGSLILIGNGIRQIYRALTGKFMKNVHVIHAQHENAFQKAGIVGYVSRGIVLIIIGYFFLRAALHSNADEAVGTEGAFNFLEENFGTVLMSLVALGLLGYGIFMFVKSKYQKIDLSF